VKLVAEGVWLVRGRFAGKNMNAYLIEDEDGVTLFDSGIRGMARGLARAAAAMGGIRRVVLSHAHPDHRGGAAGLNAPILCHPAERADVEGDGGVHYFDYGELESARLRVTMPMLMRLVDGGPLAVADTVSEGDEVAGFTVLHLPGHAPGLIALWRESDRLALVSDLFYTFGPGPPPGVPRVPKAAYNLDTDGARECIRRLAAMEPATAWPGHAEAVTGDVRAQLERAAVS
jgi:glyoxylase-like metal-dependent hydrolase (beta-lactamase superfamily II)